MKSKKRELVFTVINDLTYDRRMDRICTSLVRAGYEVTLVGRELSTSLPLLDKPYHQKRLKCWVNTTALFYAEYNVRLFFYLLFSKFDLYGGVDLDTVFPNRLVSFLKRKKFVFDSHEYFTEVIEIQDKPFVKFVWNTIAKLCLNSKTKAYTVSVSYAKVFKQLYGTTFNIIRNVPPVQEKERLEKLERFTFVYVGAVNQGRGIEESIQAIEGLDADLLICGDGDVLQDLKNELPESQKDQVHFTGYLTPDELEKRASQCHVGLLLLRSESLSYYYSLANKFFDYIHAEIPQIVIDFPEYKEIVKKHDVALLSNISVEQIRVQMEKLLTDEVLYQRLKQNIAVAKEAFSWQEEEVQLIKFYNQLWQKN